MSKKDEELLKFFLIFLGVIGVVYVFIKLVDAITHPSVVWFVIGILATLAVEAIVLCVYRIREGTWRSWR